jgi:hypothetical protein
LKKTRIIKNHIKVYKEVLLEWVYFFIFQIYDWVVNFPLLKFNAYQKGSYWNVSGNIDVVPSAPAPMQSVPSAVLPSKPAYNPVLANLGIRVGASMNQAVSCYAHGVLRREEITKFVIDILCS